MTSDDELLKRLDKITFEAFDDAPMQCEATIRQAAARIRELEAELDAYARMWPAWKEVPDWQIRGVTKGTHVIVPVEPTPEMEKAGASVCCGYTECLDVWEQMIRAAQPGASD